VDPTVNQSSKHKAQSTKHKEQSTKNKEQRTKNKEQRTKNKAQSTKNKEQRTKNKFQVSLHTMVDALYSECGSVVVGGRGTRDKGHWTRGITSCAIGRCWWTRDKGSRGGMVRALDTMLWMDLWYYALGDRSLLVDEGYGKSSGYYALDGPMVLHLVRSVVVGGRGTRGMVRALDTILWMDRWHHGITPWAIGRCWWIQGGMVRALDTKLWMDR